MFGSWAEYTRRGRLSIDCADVVMGTIKVKQSVAARIEDLALILMLLKSCHLLMV
jgi:hypothetical protein